MKTVRIVIPDGQPSENYRQEQLDKNNRLILMAGRQETSPKR